MLFGADVGLISLIVSVMPNSHDTAVQMIDTSIVRVLRYGACIARNRRQSMGRSQGGLISMIHAVVDTDTHRSDLDLNPPERAWTEIKLSAQLSRWKRP